jgi:hypothetical protein
MSKVITASKYFEHGFVDPDWLCLASFSVERDTSRDENCSPQNVPCCDQSEYELQKSLM